jgi:hypothetical protein
LPTRYGNGSRISTYRGGRGRDGVNYLDGAATVLRGVALVCVALIVGLRALARVLAPVALRLLTTLLWLLCGSGLFIWFRLLPALGWLIARLSSFCWWRLPGLVIAFRWVILAVVLGLAGWGATTEMRTSHLQAALFSRLDRGISVAVQTGPSPAIDFPKSGPYDERLGYAGLGQFLASLTAHR